MKKIIFSIIIMFSFFSIADASESGLMDKIMDFPYGVEEYRLKLQDINYVYFYDYNSQALYDNFRSVDSAIKDEIIRLYREDEIEYYRMNGIITEYNMFVYHTNKMFMYIAMKETRYDITLDDIILNHYTLSREYYDRAVNLLAEI